jgi:membrane protein
LIEAGRASFGHVRAETADFLRRVWNKADQDQIFFMASAIAFNVLICIVPLALAALGIAGMISRNIWYGDPTYRLQLAITSALPNVSNEFKTTIGNLLIGIFASAGKFTLFSILGFTWFATRLIGTLRTALREIFDLQQDRTIILGKLFDIKMVVVAGSLLALNVGVTVLINYFVARGRLILNVQVANSFWNGMLANFTAFLSIWTMFLLIYRYLPARRISWRTAMISTTFASIMFELMKRGFAVYAARTDYGALYNGLAVAAILIIWVYYTAVAFILGGEVGQVYTLRRIRKRQKERLV